MKGKTPVLEFEEKKNDQKKKKNGDQSLDRV